MNSIDSNVDHGVLVTIVKKKVNCPHISLSGLTMIREKNGRMELGGWLYKIPCLPQICRGSCY